MSKGITALLTLTHTQREVAISHLVANFCDYKPRCHPAYTAPLHKIHHPRHLQTHLICASYQQHYNFNNDKGLRMITSLSPCLFPSPNGISPLPFCVFGFPLSVVPTTWTGMSVRWEPPVSPTSSEPETCPYSFEKHNTLPVPRTCCQNNRMYKSVWSSLS